MKIEVDLRRRKVKVWMFPKNKQATLNHFLKAL
jgi:ribosomal protein L13E